MQVQSSGFIPEVSQESLLESQENEARRKLV